MTEFMQSLSVAYELGHHTTMHTNITCNLSITVNSTNELIIRVLPIITKNPTQLVINKQNQGYHITSHQIIKPYIITHVTTNRNIPNSDPTTQ